MPAGRHILVVDDDDDIRDMVSLVLASWGFRVTAARDGLEAVAALDREGDIELVFLDLMMPRMDGAQFLRQHRAGPHAQVPVIVMSGHVSAESVARELGASGCLVKPVDLEALIDAASRRTTPAPDVHAP